MAPVLDGSTPAGVASTGTVGSLVTGSFTPPVGSVLVFVASWDSPFNTTTTTTTSTGSSVGTWTTFQSATTTGLVAISWAVVTAANATTVTSTVNSGTFLSAVFCGVWTGADTTTIMANQAVQSMVTGANTISWTSTNPGSVLIVGYCDSSSTTIPTVGSCTTDFTSNPVAVATYAGHLTGTSSSGSNSISVTAGHAATAVTMELIPPGAASATTGTPIELPHFAPGFAPAGPGAFAQQWLSTDFPLPPSTWLPDPPGHRIVRLPGRRRITASPPPRALSPALIPARPRRPPLRRTVWPATPPVAPAATPPPPRLPLSTFRRIMSVLPRYQRRGALPPTSQQQVPASLPRSRRAFPPFRRGQTRTPSPMLPIVSTILARRRFVLPIRRGTASTPVPFVVAPPVVYPVVAPRPRRFLVRKSRSAVPAPVPVVVVIPPVYPVVAPRPRRGLLFRPRPGSAGPVPPGNALPPLVYPIVAWRPRRFLVRKPRSAGPAVVPVSAAPQPPLYPAVAVKVRRLAALLRARRTIFTPSPTAPLTPIHQTHTSTRPIVRGRSASPPSVTQVPVPVAAPRRRVVPTRRSAARAPAPVKQPVQQPPTPSASRLKRLILPLFRRGSWFFPVQGGAPVPVGDLQVFFTEAPPAWVIRPMPPVASTEAPPAWIVRPLPPTPYVEDQETL